MDLSNILSSPIQSIWDRGDERNRLAALQQSNLITTQAIAPPYGQRRNWVPRHVTDYGDGGAFPEIHVVQFPLEMGNKNERNSNSLPIQVAADGKVKYDILARQGHEKDKIVYSKLSDLLPMEMVAETDPSLEKPSQNEIENITEYTRRELMKITNSKIAAAMPVRAAGRQPPAQFLCYTPSQQRSGVHSGTQQKVIRLVETQTDPMEPPKFKINKKIPRGPSSPPAPVLHSPTKKLTVKEQKEWKVPPCISNWKNSKGFTIPLDKRLASDGRGLQQVHINENFAKLAESLYIADRKAREAVESRALLEKKLAQKEKEVKEEHLRQLAQKARADRARMKLPPFSHETETNDEEQEREILRQDRHNERARERNLARAAPEKRNRLQKERERDISEQIALGMPAKATDQNLFDHRLFGHVKGLDQGYENDESYNVYDKPWRNNDSTLSHIYRPPKNIDKEIYGEDLNKEIRRNRFVPDKKFAGTSQNRVERDGPVQFEKEEDPFGLDQFLSEAKKTSKRKAQEKTNNQEKKKSKFYL